VRANADRPPGTDALVVLRMLAGVAAMVFLAFTFADTDLWGHVRFGEDILDQHAVPSHDPYSFTSDRAWVNHEWLAEVLMGLAYRTAGATGLVLLKVLAVVGTLLLVSAALRRVPWRAVDHDVLIAMTILAMYQRVYPLRPQIFSVLLFAALLFALIMADRGEGRLLLAVPPGIALWANLHGAWVVGLGVLSVWVLVRFAWRNPGRVGRRWLAALWVTSAIATLLNPYGTGLWSFLYETVGSARPGIEDWQPLMEIAPVLIFPTALVAATALLALVRAQRNADPAYVLIVIALAIGTLRINRFDAFFALAVVMFLGPYLGRRRAPHPASSAGELAPLRRRPLALAVTLAIAGAGTFVAVSQATCISIRKEPEPESVAYLRARAAHARVLTFFDWGEYAIWHLSPGVTVSMDGRRETVYSDGLFQAHLRLYRNEPASIELIDRIAPDLIWLPRELDVVTTLRRAGWRAAFVGPTSVILTRRQRVPIVRTAGDPSRRRCFPDA
jgi:hypothetical protein